MTGQGYGWPYSYVILLLGIINCRSQQRQLKRRRCVGGRVNTELVLNVWTAIFSFTTYYLYVPSLSLTLSVIIFSASISNFSSSISLYTEPNHATAEPLKVKSIQLQIFLLLRKELLARLARFSVDH